MNIKTNVTKKAPSLAPSKELKLVIEFENVCGKDPRHVQGGPKFRAVFQVFRLIELLYLQNMRTQKELGLLPQNITEKNVVSRQSENGNFTLGILAEDDADRSLSEWEEDIEDKLRAFAENPENGFHSNISLDIKSDEGVYESDVCGEIPLYRITVR